MSSDPLVTVLMPLYNAGPFVRQAVESILVQSFRDFEFVIIDDGSADDGPDIVENIHDERIVLVRNPRNMGVAATLNRGLEMARGKYVARMDADDISLPDRLARQVRFMDAHPEVGISGGWVRLFGGGELPYTCRVPGDSRDVSAYMLFENSLWHVTAMLLRETSSYQLVRYNPEFSRSEDYELWIRAGEFFPLANLDRTLVKVRRHRGSATRTNWLEMTSQTETLQKSLLQKLGLVVTPQEASFHHRVGRGYRLEQPEHVMDAEAWLLKLLAANDQTHVYDKLALRKIIGKVWFRLCANSGPLGPWAWKTWRGSSLATDTKIAISDQLRFIVSIGWHMTRNKKIQKK